MIISELIDQLEHGLHVCDRDRDGRVRVWVESGHGIVLVVNGTPMLQRDAESLAMWTEA